VGGATVFSTDWPWEESYIDAILRPIAKRHQNKSTHQGQRSMLAFVNCNWITEEHPKNSELSEMLWSV
jgi:hypothetical protein